MATTTATRTTVTQNPNPIMNVQIYWRVSGIALAATAALGIVLNLIGQGALLGEGFLAFDWVHNILHVALAALALGMGFGNPDRDVSRTVAVIVGGVYLLLGVVGFLSGTLFGLGSLLGLHIELGENLVHLLIGSWGLVAGLSK